MEKNRNDGKHLTIEDRNIIESALNNNEKLKIIGECILKSPRTISYEIKTHRIFESKSFYREYRHITLDTLPLCSTLTRFPYVCNGCEKRRTCYLDHYIYRSKDADQEYRKVLKESREGIDITKDEYIVLNDTISKGVKNGKSIYSILSNHPEISKSEKTIYNYVSKGLLSISKIDLRCAAKMKPRNKNSYLYNKSNKDKESLIGRKIDDFFLYKRNNPGLTDCQLDTVEGPKGTKKCLMTLHLVNLHFMFIFLLEEKTQKNIIKVFDYLENTLGLEMFKKVFPLILTDRGTEFVNAEGIENSILDKDKKRCKLFYCDALISNQKAQIEDGHRKIRYVIPKGTSMESLKEEHILFLTSNIASYSIRDLGGSTPYNVFVSYYGKEILDKLGITKIEFDNIVLNPSLFLK